MLQQHGVHVYIVQILQRLLIHCNICALWWIQVILILKSFLKSKEYNIRAWMIFILTILKYIIDTLSDSYSQKSMVQHFFLFECCLLLSAKVIRMWRETLWRYTAYTRPERNHPSDQEQKKGSICNLGSISEQRTPGHLGHSGWQEWPEEECDIVEAFSNLLYEVMVMKWQLCY